MKAGERFCVKFTLNFFLKKRNPATGLVHYAKKRCRIYLIDPAPMNLNIPNFQQIQAPATEGMAKLLEILGL